MAKKIKLTKNTTKEIIKIMAWNHSYLGGNWLQFLSAEQINSHRRTI